MKLSLNIYGDCKKDLKAALDRRDNKYEAATDFSVYTGVHLAIIYKLAAELEPEMAEFFESESKRVQKQYGITGFR